MNRSTVAVVEIAMEKRGGAMVSNSSSKDLSCVRWHELIRRGQGGIAPAGRRVARTSTSDDEASVVDEHDDRDAAAAVKMLSSRIVRGLSASCRISDDGGGGIDRTTTALSATGPLLFVLNTMRLQKWSPRCC